MRMPAASGWWFGWSEDNTLAAALWRLPAAEQTVEESLDAVQWSARRTCRRFGRLGCAPRHERRPERRVGEVRLAGRLHERDLEGVQRALWAVDVPLEGLRIAGLALKSSVLLGGLPSYETCRIEARRLRIEGVEAIQAPSAALKSGGAGGWKVDAGERAAEPRDGTTYALFGKQPACTGWPVVDAGTAPVRVLSRVRHLDARS